MPTQITGGTARYLRRQKTGDYEHHEAEITFNVSVEDGDSYVDIARGAATEAVNVVGFMLGIEKPKIGRPPGAKNKATTTTIEHAADPITAGSTTTAQVGSGGPVADPAAMTEDPTPAAAAQSQVADANSAGPVQQGNASSATDPAAIVDESLFGSAAPAVTDTELMKAITDRNAALLKLVGPEAPKKIRELIGKYVANPGVDQARDIAKDKRGAFLKDLAGLK